MNLRKLLDAVLALGSNISIKEGKEIHKLKLVTGMTSKSIDGVYHIYSKVIVQNGNVLIMMYFKKIKIIKFVKI